MHPYAKHHSDKVSKRRVGHVMKSGGHVHSDAAADKKLFKHLIAEHDRKKEAAMPHGKSAHRLDKYARGGRAKHKPHTNINIVNVPHGASTPSVGTLPGAPPPSLPPGGPMGGVGLPPPPMGGPGMGPPGMPPRPPGMKRGGRAKYIEGESSASNLKKWSKYASKNSPPKAAFYTGGAITGEGRLEKIKAYGKRARHG